MVKMIYKAMTMAVTVFFAVSCGHSHTENTTHQHEAEEEASSHELHEGEVVSPDSHSDEIIFTKAQALAAGLEMEEVRPAPFRQVIKTGGQVLAAADDEKTVVATTTGVVDFSKSALNEGVALSAGQSVATISARTLAEGDPMAKVKAEYEEALSSYERAKSLVADKIVSEKEYEQMRAQYEKAKSNYDALTRNATSAGIRVLSPMSGFVKSRLVAQGEYVSVGQPLMVVAQNRRLQLRADVSEKHFKWLNAIRGANFKPAYGDVVYRLDKLKGRLLSFGKSSSGNSSFVPVFFEFDNVGDVIPGSFAEVYLLSAPRENVISLPEAALTESQGVYYVYVNLDEEGYRRQEVKLGQSDGERVEIISGLKPGDRVVTRGATQVRLAASSSAIPGHSHEH